MLGSIAFGPDSIRIDQNASQMVLLRAEIRAVSVHAIDTIVDGILRYVTIDHETGEYMEWSEQDEAWEQLVDQLPSFLGFERAALDSALERAAPDAEPIVVFER